MNRIRIITLLIGLAFVLSFVLPNYGQQQDAVKEIVKKNIQASGGEDKISKIKNFSFKDNGTVYYLSAERQMKMTSGKDPVITEVVLVDQTSAKRNCFNKLSDFGPLLELTFQNRARLYSGLFTLLNFKEDLQFQGKRRFGPKEHDLLTTKAKDLEIEFYVDTEDSLLKRVVFRGHNPDFGKYEINHDIGPYQEVEGLKIPSSWFGSQVGTRGNTHQVSDVKLNLTLEEDFFLKYDVNVGKTDFSEGVLKGNIVDFEMGRGNRIMISTNWTDDCIRRAGFKSEDKLILMIGESQLEVDFYASQPPRSAYGEGAILMLPNRGDENFVVYILASGYQDLVENLEPLLPIQIKKKD
ncbi:MAG: hypothetical protein OEY18_16025 [Candidatus Aminicenantes bacterium]|nr:hypothetical protein [Candidatus Aminicenantes bacterium]